MPLPGDAAIRSSIMPRWGRWAGQRTTDRRFSGWPGAGSNRRPSDFQSDRSRSSDPAWVPFVRSTCNTWSAW